MKLLGVGDIHLGRTPSRLPDTLPVSARELGPASAWKCTVDFALEEEVDAVLLAGDVVEQEDDFFEAYGDLRRGVERLTEAGVRVLAVSGNHDGQVLPRLADAVPDLRLVGRDGRWEQVDIEGRNGGRAHVLGWSFPEREVTESPLAAPGSPLASASASASRTGPLIGLLHCDRDAPPGSRYAPVSSSELERAPVDAWLLGHIHKPDELDAPRPSGYLGSLTGLDPGEPGPHGPWIFDWIGGELVATHMPLAPLRWEEVEVDVSELESVIDLDGLITDALDDLHARIVDLLPPLRPRAVGCRLRFIGRNASGGDIARAVAAADPRRLQHSPDHIYYFVHDWRMEVLPEIDLEKLARDADPPGLLARRVLALRSPDSEERRALIDGAREPLDTWSAKNPFRPLDIQPLSEGEIADLLERAALRALDALFAQRAEEQQQPARRGRSRP